MSEVFEKLNLKNQKQIVVLDAPGSFKAELAELEDVQICRNLMNVAEVDFFLGFVTRQHDLNKMAKDVTTKARGDAIIWFAYPKGTSKKYTCEFNRDNGWAELGKAGYEGVRMVAIDEDWSALRFRHVKFIKAMAIKSSGALIGEVSRLSDEINELLALDAKIEKLCEGFVWSEGPIWVKQSNFLLFTDVPGNIMYKWSESEGVTEFLNPSGFAGEDAAHLREAGANGLTLDSDGNLIICDSGSRAVASYDFNTNIKTPLIDKYAGNKLNSPNDVIVHSNGDIYFTDPPYGLKGLNDSPVKELAFNGVYKFSKETGLTLLTDEFIYPNGIAFSPDEKILYVSQSDPKNAILKAFDVQDDGAIANGRVLFDATEMVCSDKPGLPDGMAIDASGNIFLTGPGGILIITPAGKHLGTIITGTPISNCAFGGDGSVLYLTADSMLCRVQTKTKGLGF